MASGLLDVLDGGRVFLVRRAMSLWMGGRPFAVNAPAALKLRDKLFAEYPFTPEAAAWLRQNTAIAVKDAERTQGGGYWYSSSRMVFLFTGQMEAALHEHAHAWWEFHGHGLPAADELIDALIRLAAEPDPAYQDVQRLAYDYVNGIHTPDRSWPGMLVDRNDHEIFAGLASGTLGNMAKLPPYMRGFYRGLFKQ